MQSNGVAIRCIANAVAYIKETDPETDISYNTVRVLVKSGEIPSRKIGSKYFLDVQNVIDYYKGSSGGMA